VHHKSIIYNKPTRCNSGSIVSTNNHKHAPHASDAPRVHHQENHKPQQQPPALVTSWDGTNPVWMSRLVRTAPFHGQYGHFGHGIAQCAPTPTSTQDPLHPNSRRTPVAAVTVHSAPDDGRKGRPKHAEHTCSCQQTQHCQS